MINIPFRPSADSRRKGETMKYFDIGYMQEKHAEKIKKALDGKSFMNFFVETGITPAGTAVQISTDYQVPEGSIPYSDLEVLELALYCMAIAE